MAKHLVVVSVDALVYEDLEYAATLPNFKKLLCDGALIKRVKTIYPSLTHPVHASIITGASAGKTGITLNEYVDPFADSLPWYNFLDEIKCDTILHAAKRAGLTTAVSTWPVTTKGGDVIDYLVPAMFNEYFSGGEAEVLSCYREYGASECIMDIIAEGVKRYGKYAVYPSYDDFQFFCAAEIIKKYKPNLTLLHPGSVDGARHKTGLFTDTVREAVKKTDDRLGVLLKAIEDAGISNNCDVAVISDHGQLGIVRKVCPNVFLVDKGFIKLDENGKITSYDAYIASGGLTAQVYLSRPEDKKLCDDVKALLDELVSDKLCGFERVFTKEEAAELYGLYGDFSFVLESDGYSSFGSELVRPIVRNVDISDYRTGKATHGHLPTKGPQPPFIGMGPSFKKGVVLEDGNILNHAPTFAKILGITLPDAEGKCVDEILN